MTTPHPERSRSPVSLRTLAATALGIGALEAALRAGGVRLEMGTGLAAGIAAASGVAVQSSVGVLRSVGALRERHARARRSFERIVETLPMGVGTFRGGELVSGNRYLGDLLAGPFARMLHPDDRARVLATLREAEAARTPFSVDFRLSPAAGGAGGDARHGDARHGGVRHVQGRGVAVDEGGVLATFLDVTDAARAERDLEEKSQSLGLANTRLREAVLDLEANFQAMVGAFVKVVEAKDPYTAGHSERVMAYALWIGEAMGLRPEDLRVLRMGCLVHDVGKIGVPDAILTKPQALSTQEFGAIQAHPLAGVRIIESIPLFGECVAIVRSHHERLDGSGYPDHLEGDRIDPLVRIAAVADCFDAMTSTRAYRKGMDVERALGELRRDADRGALDPAVVGAFDDIVRREGLLWTPLSQAA